MRVETRLSLIDPAMSTPAPLGARKARTPDAGGETLPPASPSSIPDAEQRRQLERGGRENSRSRLTLRSKFIHRYGTSTLDVFCHSKRRLDLRPYTRAVHRTEAHTALTQGEAYGYAAGTKAN